MVVESSFFVFFSVDVTINIGVRWLLHYYNCDDMLCGSCIYDFSPFSLAGLLRFDGLRLCGQLLDDDLASNHETPPPYFCQIDTRLTCLYYYACIVVSFLVRGEKSK